MKKVSVSLEKFIRCCCCFGWVFEAKSSSASWKSKNFSEGGVGEVGDAFGDEGVIDDVFEGGEEVSRVL